ncbi:MAG TPA: GntR family transcriptional regulator [Acidobacteriaceae bacterium]|nr:GntR family transcriptional regulator [Acidobacteriaceae bacterium]
MGRRQSSALNAAGSLRDRAYAYIQRRIASGDLKPETAVSELVLAKELNMSRTPIREALNQLVAEGLLEQTPNRGTLVVQLKRQDIIELYELREALEVYAARKAARLPLRPSDLERWQHFADEIVQLKTELEKSGKRTLRSEQMHRFATADLSFHNMLMRISVNARIVKVVNDTRLLIRIFGMERPGYDADTLQNIHDQHAAIIAAVAAHDVELATQLITRHIRTSLEERLQAYDVWEREVSLQKSIPAIFAPPHD